MAFHHLVVARLVEDIRPIDRGERHEDLHQVLESNDPQAMFASVEPGLNGLLTRQNAGVANRDSKTALKPRERRMPRWQR